MRDPSEAIAACPFCGGEAKASCYVVEGAVRCMTCGATIARDHDAHDDTGYPAAIAAWNRRPASTPPGDACVRHACKRVRMEMQARIDALSQRAEVDGAMVDELLALAEGAEADRADARRYRWLRGGLELVVSPTEPARDVLIDGDWMDSAEHIDAAIDAAMAGAVTQGRPEG